jgi:tRNA (guanine-N7-)-methyltransferase
MSLRSLRAATSKSSERAKESIEMDKDELRAREIKPKRVTPYDNPPRIGGNHRMHETCDVPVEVSALVSGAPLELEIGCGRGGFVFERLAVAPHIGFIGMEVKRKWASIVDARVHTLKLNARGRVFAEDAKLAMPRLRPDNVFETIFLHFPDPWWKKKHAKRLVVGDDFLSEVHRLLVPGGNLFVQTDVEERAAQYAEQVLAFAKLAPNGDDAANGGYWLAENPYNARSPREHRAIADGLPVFRMRFQKSRT